MPFPHYRQPDNMDCGATCLRIIAKFYGRSIALPKLRQLTETTRAGASMKGIADAAEKIGFRSLGVKIDFNKFVKEAQLPCIVHWQQRHFVVVYKIDSGKLKIKNWLKKLFKLSIVHSQLSTNPSLSIVHSQLSIKISDPAHGLITYTQEEFIKNWIGNNANEKTEEGIALLLEPTPRLYQDKDESFGSSPSGKSDGHFSPLGRLRGDKRGFGFLFQYLFRYKKFLVQLILGLAAGSLLQLIFPFLTQSVVDVGIQNHNINFIYLILAAQLFLYIGKTSIELIRGWILLHLSTRINISLISDFFIKLMNLPIAFFDVKMTGDIMQRINDHQRIQNLLTNSSLSVLFSMFNLVIFGAVLAWYNWQIFFIFLVGSILYFVWIMFFLKKRKELDYKSFSQLSDEQSKVMELINGMQEIKLHNAEKQKRWSWEFVQAKLFKISIKQLRLNQAQGNGANFINEVKNILITVLSAKLVVDGQLTLGMMLSISYITGQLNGPIMQLVNFIHSAQDTQIALERLSEIHNREDEENPNEEKITDIFDTNSSSFESGDERSDRGMYSQQNTTQKKAIKSVGTPPSGAGGSSGLNFHLKNLHFRYKGSSEFVIKGLDLIIPENKVTAIVGASGSGKTTLMKLLLKFYEPDKGEIIFGKYNLSNISHQTWRENIGVVMQEGYIFNDTIANNIAVGESHIDRELLNKSVEIANIKDFIESLPLAYNTKIGMEGVGMSTGQKQRLRIARAVYRNPRIIFFDEATSALDAKNEKEIMEKLNGFFKERTAIVIAHRLSTVKNADQIVVLDEGKIIERGNHKELIKQKGSYYKLVKNQLELEKLSNAN